MADDNETCMRLFPSPVFKFTGLGLDNEKLLEAILGDKAFYKNTTSQGNYTSEDYNLQESDRAKDLVDIILAKARHIFADRLGYEFEGLQISTMWCNVQRPEPAAGHYPHEHANSFFSGTYYAEITDTNSPISFYSPHRVKMISLAVAEANELNQMRIEIPVSTGDLLLWPSELLHAVVPYQGPNRRVSISFNIMPKGPAGQPGWNYQY